MFTPKGNVKGYFGRAFREENEKSDSKAEQGGNLGNLRVPRQDLRRMLLNRLHPGTVIWGKALLDYEETEDGVTAVFTDSAVLS